jgi:hypothetical protein
MMVAKIKSEMSVGLTPEIEAALNVATEFEGIKASQFGRMAILERLVARGYMQHPGIQNFQNVSATIKTVEK